MRPIFLYHRPQYRPQYRPSISRLTRWLLLVLLTITLFPAPQPARAQACADEATLVETNLEPNSQVVTPGTEISVQWTLLNSGDCTWGRTYRLSFIDGDRMDGPRTLRQRTSVRPGKELAISIELTAPDDFDTYSGTWQLRNGDGENFGPELTIQVEVGEKTIQGLGQSPAEEVVLPEVLALGGLGGAGDPDVLYQCLQNGQLPTVPTLVIEEEISFSTALFLCSLPEGAEVTIELTNPQGETFQRSFIEDAPVTGIDENGNEITGSVLEIPLRFLTQAPTGEWLIEVWGSGLIEGYADEASIQVLPDDDFDQVIEDWPVGPIDPMIAAMGLCGYAYTPGQAMHINGSSLTPNRTITLGLYHDRFGVGYLVDQLTAKTDANGTFVIDSQAATEPGMYNVYFLAEIDDKGFDANKKQYDPFTSDTRTYFTCYSVSNTLDTAPNRNPEAVPLRLAFAQGTPGQSEILVYDLDEGIAYYPTYTAGECDSSEPSWWPDGQWVLYQSNCVTTFTDGWTDVGLGYDYDLYASLIDPSWMLPEEEKLIRLTQTPNLHETEPDANADGLIVYNAIPVGYALDLSGELRILNVNDGSDATLNLYGRAPVWSPDGTRIAFMSDAEGAWQIYYYDLTDDTLWLVSQDCATHCRLPDWSPDGKQIIYHQSLSLQDFTPESLWIATLDSANSPRRYLSGAYGRPAWSSANWIALQGPGGIYRAAPGRNPNQELYFYSDGTYGEYWSPVWSR